MDVNPSSQIQAASTWRSMLWRQRVPRRPGCSDREQVGGVCEGTTLRRTRANGPGALSLSARGASAFGEALWRNKQRWSIRTWTSLCRRRARAGRS